MEINQNKMFQLVSLQVLDKVTFFSLYFKFFTQSTLLSAGGKRQFKKIKIFKKNVRLIL